MLTCLTCRAVLNGDWQLSNKTTNSVHLGVLNGYFFGSGSANHINAYCLKCYHTAIINYADTIKSNLNNNLIQGKSNLIEQTNSNNQFFRLKTQLNTSKSSYSKSLSISDSVISDSSSEVSKNSSNYSNKSKSKDFSYSFQNNLNVNEIKLFDNKKEIKPLQDFQKYPNQASNDLTSINDNGKPNQSRSKKLDILSYLSERE